jgi:cyclophilin family peptidyl-prolyl cis-trans isomerase
MKLRALFALAIACLAVAACVRAEDTLVLQDGTTRKGKVILRGNTYTVVAGKKLYQYYFRDVKELNGKPVGTDDPVALIKTDVGDIKVVLYEKEAPNTVANFITLAEKGFYKGQAFHRIIPGFMAQGGCPNSKEGATGTPGTGGPGYTIKDEVNPRLSHDGRGVLSMAKMNAPNTGGSQFFLCFAPAPHLDGKHTVFGRVIEGIGVLDKLEAVGSEDGTPSKTIRFDVQILSKGKHPYTVQKYTPPNRPVVRPAKTK